MFGIGMLFSLEDVAAVHKSGYLLFRAVLRLFIAPTYFASLLVSFLSIETFFEGKIDEFFLIILMAFLYEIILKI